MQAIPTIDDLKQLPRLRPKKEISYEETIIYYHLYISKCEWFVAEFDGEDLLYGFVIVNGDFSGGKWGYFSYLDLHKIESDNLKVDNDASWKVGPLSNYINSLPK